MSDERDEMMERIVAGLRPLPEVDPAAKARVLVAVAAERERDQERARRRARHRRAAGWSGIAALAASLAFGAFVLGRERGATTAASLSTAATTTPTTGAPAARLAAAGADAAAPRPVQLVFRAPAAKRVSVVGDFTGWDPARAVMTRDSASGLWSVTLSIAPGRHVYAFLVDDTSWVRDPRAPAAPDADFGRPGSVLLVGRP